MPWPMSQDYNEAIQNPRSSFGDAELRNGSALCNALGMPMPRSGNFADVYEFIGASGEKWAIKCFTREVPGLQERYAEISKHLARAKLPFTVDFEYLGRGIRIRGEFYPVLKMKWVDGFLLNEFVRDNLDKPKNLQKLGTVWVRMAKGLHEAGITHADLQHGNVILVRGSDAAHLAVKLIDYDGMWLPALANKKSGELGHSNYQHPLRAQQNMYRAEVDRLPLLVIACALRALKVAGKSLWDKYDNGDNLLFKATDLANPGQSPLMRELWSMPDDKLHDLTAYLLCGLTRAIDQTPPLHEILLDTQVRPVSDAVEKTARAILGPVACSKVARPASLPRPAAVQTPLSAPEQSRTSSAPPPPTRDRERRPSPVPRKASRHRVLLFGWLIMGAILLGAFVLVWIRWNSRNEFAQRDTNPPPQSKDAESSPHDPPKENEVSKENIQPPMAVPRFGEILAGLGLSFKEQSPTIGKATDWISRMVPVSRGALLTPVSAIVPASMYQDLPKRIVDVWERPDTQRRLVLGLSTMDPDRIEGFLKFLRAKLQSQDAMTRQYSLDAIGRLGRRAQPAVPDLIPLLKDGPVEKQAADVLVAIGEPAAADLISLVANKNESTPVRTIGADILHRLGPVEFAATGFSDIAAVLEDRNEAPHLREKVLAVLRVHETKFPDVVTAAFNKVVEEPARSDNKLLRYGCASLLGRFQGPKAPPLVLNALFDCLKDEKVPSGDSHLFAVRALRAIGVRQVATRAELTFQLRRIDQNTKAGSLRNETAKFLVELEKHRSHYPLLDEEGVLNADTKPYTVDLTERKAFVIEMTSHDAKNLRPKLEITDPSGKPTSKEGGGRKSSDARVPFFPTVAGVHGIFPTSSKKGQSGKFTVSVLQAHSVGKGMALKGEVPVKGPLAYIEVEKGKYYEITPDIAVKVLDFAGNRKDHLKHKGEKVSVFTTGQSNVLEITASTSVEKGRTFELEIKPSSCFFHERNTLIKIGDANKHEVPLTKGKTYLIEMVSEDPRLAPSFRLFYPPGKQVTGDVDGTAGQSARIEYPVPTTGAYTIRAGSVRGVGLGAYVVIVQEK